MNKDNPFAKIYCNLRDSAIERELHFEEYVSKLVAITGLPREDVISGVNGDPGWMWDEGFLKKYGRKPTSYFEYVANEIGVL